MFNEYNKFNNFRAAHVISQRLKNIECMFKGCSKLTKVDLSMLDANNALDMKSMFYECSELKEIDISSFNFHNVENIGNMFYRCSSITKLDLPLFEYHNPRCYPQIIFSEL